MKKAHAPIHPGEILLEEFLKPYGVSQYELAKVIGVSPRRINEIVHGLRSITPDTALRMSRAFDVSDRFWLNLQNRYDIEIAQESLEKTLAQISPLPAVVLH
jgi:addiction module HigA family antidote